MDHGVSTTPSPEWFAQWMSRGGETWTGTEDVPVMRHKFIRRVLQWATDEITDPKHDVRTVGFEAYLSLRTSFSWPCLCSLSQWEEVKRVFRHQFDESDTVEDLKRMLHEAMHSDELTTLEKDVNGEYQPMTADPYPYFGFIPLVCPPPPPPYTRPAMLFYAVWCLYLQSSFDGS